MFPNNNNTNNNNHLDNVTSEQLMQQIQQLKRRNDSLKKENELIRKELNSVKEIPSNARMSVEIQMKQNEFKTIQL
jgi:cell division protein FtsB